MSKTFSDLVRHALNGPTMGTRWSALFHAPAHFDPAPVEAAAACAVARVDAQMSTWNRDSDLNRVNAAAPGEWLHLPPELMTVLAKGLEVGRITDGAFDIGLGDAVLAWGFGRDPADVDRVRLAREKARRPAHDVVELDLENGRLRKHGPIVLDLNGIAKGYGVDKLLEAVRGFGIEAALVSIDGELRALGSRPDGTPWTVAVETPDTERRAPHSIVELADMAVATSGDYRHWVMANGRRLSHTIDPRHGQPLARSPASVTVLAGDCMTADAWATAMMVLGEDQGLHAARMFGLSVLYLRAGHAGAIGTGHFA